MARQLYSDLEHFIVTSPSDYVAHVQINRPKKYNSFIQSMWIEFGRIFDRLSLDSNVRSIVLSGAGDKAFTSGLDVQFASQMLGPKSGDASRLAFDIKRAAAEFQKCISSAERCEKPVICVIHGISLGLAMDIACCTDIRICTKDVQFAVKELDIGMAADVGTLTRLPKLVGSYSWVKDITLTARTFGADEALRQGFVSQVLDSKELAIEAGVNLAAFIATKSPVAVKGTKALLDHARDHTVADSLDYTAVWTGAAIQSADMTEALVARVQKRSPIFEKL